ncbi:MAG: hypothetical protein LUE93_16595 [Bacteroides sp.]|nr:hypothetical protein [Bacteroides sp.]
MAKSHLNINKQFMVGNGILAFAVIIVVVIFVYMSMRLQANRNETRTFVEVYEIELLSGFAGKDMSAYINDSLIYNEIIPRDSLKFTINRFEEHSALLLVDNETEKVSTIELSDRGGKVRLVQDETGIKQLY